MEIKGGKSEFRRCDRNAFGVPSLEPTRPQPGVTVLKLTLHTPFRSWDGPDRRTDDDGCSDVSTEYSHLDRPGHEGKYGPLNRRTLPSCSSS